MTSINDIAIVYEKILTITIEKRGSSDDSSKFDDNRYPVPIESIPIDVE